MIIYLQRLIKVMFFIILPILLPHLSWADVGWLNCDPNAIWSRSPGFYKDADHWYAIIHAKPAVTRVRLSGDFTNGESNAVDLNKSPEGKYWWFKGTDASFKRVPVAGNKYNFILNEGSDPNQLQQDPAARQVENSGLGSKSIVTVSTIYHWGDSGWSPPEWNRHIIYQLHPLRFTDRNAGLKPLQQVTEELNKNGVNDYLNNLGITTIQLLPVNEFPVDHSWGYNPSFFYAVESAYGQPDDLKVQKVYF